MNINGRRKVRLKTLELNIKSIKNMMSPNGAIIHMNDLIETLNPIIDKYSSKPENVGKVSDEFVGYAIKYLENLGWKKSELDGWEGYFVR